MGGWHRAGAPNHPGPQRTSVVAMTGDPAQGDLLAKVVAGLARRDDVVIICGLPMLRAAMESTCLVGLLHAAMPWRATAVVPVEPCPVVQDADVALIERLRDGRTVVVVVVVTDAPVVDLMPVAEQLRGRLDADELALAEASRAGLVMQRIPKPSEDDGGGRGDA
jgi:hypothetical protein